ncbi:MAG: gamma-glutamyltransferase [Pseudomonadota bacterium]
MKCNCNKSSHISLQAGFFLLLLALLAPAWGASGSDRAAAIASAHPLATAAGERILRQGGNAFDAAVAVSAALAVVEPYSSGLGGGGLWLLHRARDGREVLIDGRETAPGKASAGMYLNAKGEPIAAASLNGPLAAAIPGMPAALVHLAQNYGKLPLAHSLAPAIDLARNGFRLDRRFTGMAKNYQDKLRADPHAAGIFLRGNLVPVPGSVLRQPQLAATLTEIARHGADGFYRGWVADEMVQSVKRAGGIWEYADLAHYRVIEREPARFTYREAVITTAPLPSSGALTLAQGLNILENFPLVRLHESDRSHLIAEALRRAYQDRAEYLGDSDFVDVPTEKLMSKDYGRERATTIDLHRATPDVRLDDGSTARAGGTETTHFSIMDRAGNRVAATLSINTNFGSGFVAGNTGVLLNNEMDDFSIAPAMPNAYGLHGNQANAIMPGKRPLSSMSPTFVENAKGVLIVGTPGGSRIISMVLLAIVNYVDDRQTDPGAIAGNPRFHHQYLPDQIEIEPDSFHEEWISGLKLKGHQVTIAAQKWGNMQLIFFDKETRRSVTASDPRGATAMR